MCGMIFFAIQKSWIVLLTLVGGGRTKMRQIAAQEWHLAREKLRPDLLHQQHFK